MSLNLDGGESAGGSGLPRRMSKMKRSRKGGKEKERGKRRGRDRIRTWTEEKKTKKGKEKVHRILESRNSHDNPMRKPTNVNYNQNLRMG